MRCVVVLHRRCCARTFILDTFVERSRTDKRTDRKMNEKEFRRNRRAYRCYEPNRQQAYLQLNPLHNGARVAAVAAAVDGVNKHDQSEMCTTWKQHNTFVLDWFRPTTNAIAMAIRTSGGNLQTSKQCALHEAENMYSSIASHRIEWKLQTDPTQPFVWVELHRKTERRNFERMSVKFCDIGWMSLIAVWRSFNLFCVTTFLFDKLLSLWLAGQSMSLILCFTANTTSLDSFDFAWLPSCSVDRLQNG